VKSAIPLLVAAALVAGCGSDEEDPPETVEGTDTGAETAPPAPENAAVFRSDEVAFTFEYPEAMAARTKRDGDVLGQVSLAPGDRLNAIKVRRTADRELRQGRYLAEFQKDFEKAVGEVEKRTEKIGARKMGVLEFEDSIEDSGETTEFTSSSYFFTGAGATWQVECIADAGHREEIDAACRLALESVEFPRRKKGRGAKTPKQVD
jgi:hypothetical protein